MSLSKVARGILILVLVATSTGPLWALTDEEIFRDFRFNFTNPGARAVGLGGAFIAAADDSTAAQANPAALHYVRRMEAFIEFRSVDASDETFAPAPLGSLDPTASTIFLDIQAVTERQKQSFPSFASFALPFNIAKRRATFAVSRQVVLKVETGLGDAASGEGTALRQAGSGYPTWINDGSLPCSDPSEIGTFQKYSVCNTVAGGLDAELLHYNFGLSWSFADDFSIGLTATYATLDMQADVTNTVQDPRGVITSSINPRVPSPSGAFPPIVQVNTINDTDSDTTYTIGVHWHPDKVFPGGESPLRFGLVYRKGAELEVAETRGEIDQATGATTPASGSPATVVLREPDRYGLGFAYVEGRWTTAIDVERINYSDLLTGFESGVNFFTNHQQLTDSFPDYNFGDFEFTVDDATVVHAGLEYLFPAGAWTWSMRGGFYNAPDNRIRLESADITDATGGMLGPQAPTPEQMQAIFKEVFGAGEDANHFTAGFSFETPIQLQFQFAVDLSKDVDEFVMSAIWRFGKRK